MSSTREQIPPRRKRRNSSIKLHSAEFYNSLSKVRLTRRSLKEFDRRTCLVNRPQQPASASASREVHQRDTAKQIQKFARHGGPELHDLRGYPAPTDLDPTHAVSPSRYSRTRSSGNKQTKSTLPTSKITSRASNKRSSAYDNNFEQHLIDHYIYLNNRKSKLGKSTRLHQILTKPRPSLSLSCFPDDAFEDFQWKNEDVIDEGEVMRDVVPIIAGNSDIPSKQNLLFTRLDPIANGTTVDAKPDFYDGARLGDIDKRVRDDIRKHIIPTGHATAPVAPNFFLEVKRPGGGTDVAKRQACYDGALGARGMHQLQSYGEDEPVYDGNPYTLTSTYHDGTLKVYATHPTAGREGSTEYHMTQLRSLDLTDTPQSFREGATAFRNARDWAQEQRDAFISVANERARAVNAEPSPAPSDHIGASDLQDTTHLMQAEDPKDGSQHYMSQHPVHPESSTFQSLRNNASETTNVYLVEESETSTDELALDTYGTAFNKRRKMASRKAVSKAPRCNDRTRRRHRSKK